LAHAHRQVQFRGGRNTDSNAYGNSKGYTNTKAATHSGSAALARAVIVQRREFANRFVNCRKARKSSALSPGRWQKVIASTPRTPAPNACSSLREAAVSGVQMQAARAVEM